MGHILRIEIPEIVHQMLAKKAEALGQSEETFAAELLIAATNDPLDEFIGAFNSGGMPWADRHDEFIGKASIQNTDHDNSDG